MFPHLGKNFVEQKTRIAVAQIIIFEASIGLIRLARGERFQHAGVNHDGDGHRHVVLGNEVVKHYRDTQLAVIQRTPTILEEHHTGRLVRHILGRHINPVIAHRAGINPAGPGVFRDGALGHPRLALGIRTQGIILGCPSPSREQHEQANDQKRPFHRFSSAKCAHRITELCSQPFRRGPTRVSLLRLRAETNASVPHRREYQTSGRQSTSLLHGGIDAGLIQNDQRVNSNGGTGAFGVLLSGDGLLQGVLAVWQALDSPQPYGRHDWPASRNVWGKGIIFSHRLPDPGSDRPSHGRSPCPRAPQSPSLGTCN